MLNPETPQPSIPPSREVTEYADRMFAAVHKELESVFNNDDFVIPIKPSSNGNLIRLKAAQLNIAASTVEQTQSETVQLVNSTRNVRHAIEIMETMQTSGGKIHPAMEANHRLIETYCISNGIDLDEVPLSIIKKLEKLPEWDHS